MCSACSVIILMSCTFPLEISFRILPDVLCKVRIIKQMLETKVLLATYKRKFIIFRRLVMKKTGSVGSLNCSTDIHSCLACGKFHDCANLSSLNIFLYEKLLLSILVKTSVSLSCQAYRWCLQFCKMGGRSLDVAYQEVITQLHLVAFLPCCLLFAQSFKQQLMYNLYSLIYLIYIYSSNLSSCETLWKSVHLSYFVSTCCMNIFHFIFIDMQSYINMHTKTKAKATFPFFLVSKRFFLCVCVCVIVMLSQQSMSLNEVIFLYDWSSIKERD